MSLLSTCLVIVLGFEHESELSEHTLPFCSASHPSNMYSVLFGVKRIGFFIVQLAIIEIKL
jgi:hypothetical protein